MQTGTNVIQQISEELKVNILAPAKAEAQSILFEAHAEAQQIISQANQEAEQLLVQARAQIAKEQHAFQSTLAQAAKQTLETVRQAIENDLVHSELHRLIVQKTSHPDTIALLIEAVVKTLEKEGMHSNFNLIIPETVSTEALLAALSPALNQTLRQGKVLHGKFLGGVKIHLVAKGITIDISDEALLELLALQKEGLREILFNHV